MKNVLIVDDDPGFVRILSEVLLEDRKLALRVLTAENGSEALAVLEKEAVDLVVSDLKMPVMDGCEFISRLREAYPDLPVLVMSGHIGPAAESRLSALSVRGLIEKSGAFRQMAALITGILDQPLAAGVEM